MFNGDIKKTVTSFFRFLEQATGINIEQMVEDSVRSGHTSINLSDFGYQKQMLSILNSINVEHYESAFIKCHNLARDFFGLGNNLKKDASPEEYREAGRRLTMVADYLDAFDHFSSEYYPELLERYRETGVVGSDSFKSDVNLNTVGDISLILEQISQDVLFSKHLHTYIFRNGEGVPEFETGFHMRDVIVCSDNLNYILTTASKPVDSDEYQVSVCLKIEPIIDYTYFIIFVQYNDSTWIVTDNIEWANPHVAVSSRNPRRRSESREEETWLPYRIIDDVISWRSDSTEISKQRVEGQKEPIELYVKTLSEIMGSDSAKLQMLEVIKTMIKKVSETGNSALQIGTFSQMLTSQKLIGSTVNMDTDEFESQFETQNLEKVKQMQAEWILPENSDENKTRALPAPIVRDLQYVKDYRDDVLVTAEQAARYAEYYVAKRQADALKTNLDNYFEKNFMKESLDFQKLMLQYEQNILPYAMCGTEVWLYDIDTVSASFGMGNGAKIIHRLAKTFRGLPEERKDEDSWWYKNEFFAMKESAKTNCGYKGEYYVFDGKCVDCGAKVDRKGVLVFINHWKHLVSLLGCPREEIPQCFKNYASYAYRPYTGNSIISNINPLYLVEDPLSRKFDNRLRLVWPLCGNCLRKYTKRFKKFDKALVLFSSKQMKVVDIVEYESYKETHKEEFDL